MHDFSVFLGAAVVLAVVPGPGMLYVTGRTLGGGRSEGLMSTLGTGLGGLVHVALAAAGLSALVAASAEAFVAVKYAGAAYLVYLGLRALLAAHDLGGAAASRSVGVQRAFCEGVVTEVLNVKTAVFFLAFLPQFAGSGPSAPWQFGLLGLICVVLNTTADLLCVLFASRLLPRLRTRRNSGRYASYVSGGLLSGLGLWVALADGDH